MKRGMKRLSHAAFAIVAAAVLSFGAQTAYASASMNECDPGLPGWIGYCPPFDASTCAEACLIEYGAGNNYCIPYCCICQV